LYSTDTIARIGGDEFIILLPGIVHEKNIVKLANKLLEVIKRTFCDRFS
jgi:GGDEF domain-containing protein